MKTFSEQLLMPNFHRVEASLLHLGTEPKTLYREVGIFESEVENDQVSILKYLSLLERAAESLNMPFLGLRIAQARSIPDLGLYGYMIRNADNIANVIKLANQYVGVITPGTKASLQMSTYMATWTYDFPGLPPDLCRQEIELSVMEFINLIRDAIGQPDWRPLAVYFKHDPPSDIRPLREAMSDKIKFRHKFNGVGFMRQLLTWRVSNADPVLMNLLQLEVQKSFEEYRAKTDIVTHLKLLIASRIGKADISSEWLAREINMSRSSLHRRLAEAGTSVQKLRDEVIGRLSIELLTHTNSSVSEVALRLGYADSSSFNRNFKRLTGVTPLAYRRNGKAIEN